MQIIDRPKQYRLPFAINKKVNAQKNPIPQFDISKISNRKKSVLDKIPKIHYQINIDDSHFRPIIRTALSKHLTFENIDRKGKYSIDQMVSGVKQPFKTLNSSSETVKKVVENIRDIFGEDFQIRDRDIISVQGNITTKCYVFFITNFRPFSLCCHTPIFIKTADFKEHDYLKKDHSMNKPQYEASTTQQPKIFRTQLICCTCNKTIIKFIGQKNILQKAHSKQRIKTKEEALIEIERRKISLSVKIGSGRFRRQGLTKQRYLGNHRYNKNNQQQNYGRSISVLPFHSKSPLFFNNSNKKKQTQNQEASHYQ